MAKELRRGEGQEEEQGKEKEVEQEHEVEDGEQDRGREVTTSLRLLISSK